ncbi:MAG TPA: DNA gyrase modulator, partial [Nitrospira sp.]|nr:DNA gyrase modulator [Nitrospira sp.]
MHPEKPNRAIQSAHGHLVQLASDVLAMAKKDGATEADVVVADGENLSVQVRLGSVDRLTKAREKRLGLRVFVGKRSATTSTSDFSSESLRRLVSETCALARAVVEDSMSGLPEPEQLAQEQPDLDIYDDTKVDAE